MSCILCLRANTVMNISSSSFCSCALVLLRAAAAAAFCSSSICLACRRKLTSRSSLRRRACSSLSRVLAASNSNPLGASGSSGGTMAAGGGPRGRPRVGVNVEPSPKTSSGFCGTADMHPSSVQPLFPPYLQLTACLQTTQQMRRHSLDSERGRAGQSRGGGGEVGWGWRWMVRKLCGDVKQHGWRSAAKWVLLVVRALTTLVQPQSRVQSRSAQNSLSTRLRHSRSPVTLSSPRPEAITPRLRP
jgi:hypothetical protein